MGTLGGPGPGKYGLGYSAQVMGTLLIDLGSSGFFAGAIVHQSAVLGVSDRAKRSPVA